MRIKILDEKLYHMNEDYESEEIEVSDSDIHRYLDLKYDSEEIINLGQQFNPNVENSDLNAAYAEIIKHFDEVDSDSSQDLIDLKNYLEDQIYKNYKDM